MILLCCSCADVLICAALHGNGRASENSISLGSQKCIIRCKICSFLPDAACDTYDLPASEMALINGGWNLLKSSGIDGEERASVSGSLIHDDFPQMPVMDILCSSAVHVVSERPLADDIVPA